MINQSEHIILPDESISSVLDKLNNLIEERQVLFVVNSHDELLGSVTDGDVRRGLIAGKQMNDAVSEIMHSEVTKIFHGDDLNEFISCINRSEIKILPVVDAENKVLELLDVIRYKRKIPVDAFIMAGGKGTRLKPLTDNTPKPLLLVGDKPILEHNIDHLKSSGIDRFHISIAYLGDQIKEYFGNGVNKSIDIQYVKEDKPMGTAGALSLKEDFENDYILLMNSDLLTDLDVDKMFEFFLDCKADMVVATIPYEVEIPYGVIETENNNVIQLREKPKYTYQSNAGIYLMKRTILEFIPENKHFNATDLIESLIKNDKKVMNYPLYCYWLDIGKPEDFRKAQNDIKSLEL